MSNQNQPEPKSFTGVVRRRTTKKSVLVVDRVARGLISVGGIATILAVVGVFVFLLWVVGPLFLPAKISGLRSFDVRWGEEPVHLGADEYRVLGWALLPSGRIEVFRLDDGADRASHPLFPPGQARSWSFALAGEQAVFGLDDGTIQLVEIGFETEIFDPDDVPDALRRALETGSGNVPVNHGDGVVERIPSGQFRAQTLRVRMGPELEVAPGPVVRVAYADSAAGMLIAALVDVRPQPAVADDVAAVEDDAATAPADAAAPAVATPSPGPRLFVVTGEEESNFLTGESTLEFGAPIEVPLPDLATGAPVFLGISGTGNDLYLAWADGSLARLAIGEPESAYVAEQGRLLPAGATLTTIGFLLGNNTLVWGGSDGRLEAGFPIRRADYAGAGALAVQDPRATAFLVRTKELARTVAAPRTVAASARSRMIMSGFDDGEIRLFNVTNEAQLARVELPVGEAVATLAMAPKEDVLLAATPGRIHVAELDPRYAEASFNALFRPTWYEGYAEPIHSWQSSSGSDDFEPKHSLMPLIFGTLKATFYSMLFGAPLALLAAIFTSEFLDPRVRSVIKPTIELMASLPSVVLGFLAALVVAPFVENVVPTTLAGFVTFPLAFLLGAYLWQLLPAERTIRLERWRFAFLILMLPVGLVFAIGLGPLIETLFFAGDLKAWLAWEPGVGEERFAGAVGGWLFLTFPLSVLVVWLSFNRLANPWLRLRSARWERRRLALVDLAKLAAGIVLTAALAITVAATLDALGLDPRGGFVDTYVQRNALIVGFIMGFAIIPIIYTISEDALGAVPEHLRSASLGAGATTWQTAVRIVIPTAMSGLFSALMIGLGRAVGETMIVLMAAGNTPVMSWNVFEGFRTLSANIAVELPEAVQGSSHYRILFLAALVLFAMTFVVNTAAEIVRLRFRKRAYQL